MPSKRSLGNRCRGVGRWRRTHRRQTNPISARLGLKMGVGAKNKPNRTQFNPLLMAWPFWTDKSEALRWAGCDVINRAKQSQFPAFLAWKWGSAKKQSQFEGRIATVRVPEYDRRPSWLTREAVWRFQMGPAFGTIAVLLGALATVRRGIWAVLT